MEEVVLVLVLWDSRSYILVHDNHDGESQEMDSMLSCFKLTLIQGTDQNHGGCGVIAVVVVCRRYPESHRIVHDTG